MTNTDSRSAARQINGQSTCICSQDAVPKRTMRSGTALGLIGILVERTTRFTMLLHLPPMAGHGTGPRAKNGPALAWHGAEAVRDAITGTIVNAT